MKYKIKNMNLKQGLEKEYEDFVTENSDPYSKAIVFAAQEVMRLLDLGEKPAEAEYGLHGQGLTGFMAGAAISIVVRFHLRGEEMKAWWNRHIKGEPDETGTNNPAIMTI